MYYGFKYRFCNIRSGNEKGHAENSVDFVRRKAFSCNNNFDNIQDLQDKLKQNLEKHNSIKTKYLNNNFPIDILNIEKKLYKK